jgi:hypothetical protein
MVGDGVPAPVSDGFGPETARIRSFPLVTMTLNSLAPETATLTSPESRADLTSPPPE